MNEPVIELHGVTRTFDGPVPVLALRPADLVIRAGEYVAIMGRSGSGKSTLMHLLGLLDRPTAGTYLLGGTDTSGLSDVQRTRLRGRMIGFVFQAFHLLAHRTVVANVELGLMYSGVPRADRHKRARAVLSQVGLSDRADFFPTTLSGGERQRVAIARAIATRPALLLADEPTGNLDSATAESVLELFDELNSTGLAVITVTHDEAVAAHAQRQVRINDGMLTEVT
ncbi:ABC transporter ATP-binding protein [Kibdelosporangium aridum]|uniref:Putative ABC transport system ATP-binding protein n=1 Tax=Kibdelosporangium aridum TaxID=2030 RepID=A0A1W2FDA4_KIBAR|nr:ABC transporter ATP-binding protein [Kibdelosporangium aridum]SMD19598.1 putative ABC transport system ATP-binding protein [Kibdelosporangium aridum]